MMNTTENGRRGMCWRMAMGAAAVVLVGAMSGRAEEQKPGGWTDQEKPIAAALGTLRKLPEDARAKKTKELALEIRALPAEAIRARSGWRWGWRVFRPRAIRGTRCSKKWPQRWQRR